MPTAANWLNTTPPYAYEDLAPVSGGFDRVGYCLELRTAAGATNWVWTSFAAGDDATLLGLPTRSGQVFRGNVSALTVATNVAGVTTGAGRSGYLEMWPNTYRAKSARQVVGASDSTYDSDDSPDAATGYGSFQVSDAVVGKPVSHSTASPTRPAHSASGSGRSRQETRTGRSRATPGPTRRAR